MTRQLIKKSTLLIQRTLNEHSLFSLCDVKVECEETGNTFLEILDLTTNSAVTYAIEYIDDPNTTIEELLSDLYIEYAEDTDNEIHIAESIEVRAMSMIEDIQTGFSMQEQAEFNKFKFIIVKDDMFMKIDNAQCFSVIDDFFDSFVYNRLITNNLELLDYFTKIQLEIFLRKKYFLSLSSIDKEIIEYSRDKLRKARKAVLNFNKLIDNLQLSFFY